MQWWERLLRVEVLVMILAFGLPMVGIICASVVAVMNHRSNNELKRAMIRQGMSAEDIERVLKAKPAKG